MPKFVCAALALLALLAAGCRKERPGGGLLPSRRGPVIIISIDTLRADHLPLYGYNGVKTPNIDALAKDGIAFEAAWAHVPLTLPSHVAMLTGELPAENGVRDNLGYRFDAAAHATIPSLLKKEGYATGAAVSAYVLRGSTGLAAAFDSYEDVMDSSEGASAGELQRSGTRTLAVSEKWIDANRGRPFFFMLHLYEPHAPYDPPEPFRSEYPGHEYDGEIAAADAVVGGFVSFLKEKNLYDDATIIFMSDHGEGLGDHGENQHGLFLYRESIRVPLVLKLPGSKKGGTRIATPVELIDIFPTVAQIVKADPPKKLAGRSLLAIAEGEKPDRRMFSETKYPRIHLGLSDLASLVDATHHYIDAPRAELYDMRSDPQEKKNILTDQRRVFAAMKRELETYDRTLKAPSNISREEAAKLSALGYLSAPAPAAGGELGDPKDHIADIEAAAEAARADGHRKGGGGDRDSSRSRRAQPEVRRRLVAARKSVRARRASRRFNRGVPQDDRHLADARSRRRDLACGVLSQPRQGGRKHRACEAGNGGSSGRCSRRARESVSLERRFRSR